MNQDRYPSLRQALLLLVWVYLLIMAIGFPVGILIAILDPVVNRSLGGHPALLAFINLAAIGLVLRWGFRKANAPFKEVFPLAPIQVSLLLPMSLTVVGTGLLLSELDNLFRTLLPMPAGMADFFMKLAGGRTSLWGSILVSVVIAPLTEESLFRGLILRGFLSRYPVSKAVVTSAVLFGLFHLNPWQFLPATLLGVIFAWWFVRTGSLLPCLFGHALTNAVPLILMGILHIEISGLTSEPIRVEFQPLWLDLIGLLCTGSGVWLLIHRFGKSRGFNTEQIVQ